MAAPSGPAPLAWWKLDESSGTTAADSSGNGYTGTTVGNPAWVAGKVGNALDLSPTKYVNIPDAPGLRFGSGNFTMAAWIKPPDATQMGAIVSKTDAANESVVLLIGSFANFMNTASKRLSILFGDFSSSNYAAVSADDVANNTWRHVAVTRTSSAVTLYVDGSPVSSSTTDTGWNAIITAPIFNTGPWQIGYYNGNWPFTGLVDDVRLYNTALTASDIATIAAQ